MDRAKALKIYLFVNCFSILFMIFILAWIFRIPQLSFINRTSYWLIILPYVIVINLINTYAKKIGNGLLNPVRTNKKAVYFKYASLAFFLGGILLGILLDKSYMYIALVAIPLEVYRVYIAHTNEAEKVETDLIDDFELE